MVTIARAVERVVRWDAGGCRDSAEVLLVEQARHCDPYELEGWRKTCASGWPPTTGPPRSASGTSDIENTESQCLLHHSEADGGCETEILPDGRVRRYRARKVPQAGPAIHEPPPDPGGRSP